MENVKNKNLILYWVIVAMVVLASVAAVFSAYTGAKFTSTADGTSSTSVAKVVFNAEACNSQVTIANSSEIGIYWVRVRNYTDEGGSVIKSEVSLRATISITVSPNVVIGQLVFTENSDFSAFTIVTPIKSVSANDDGTVTYTFDNSSDYMKYTQTYKNGKICKYYGIEILGGDAATYEDVKVTVTATQRD